MKKLLFMLLLGIALLATPGRTAPAAAAFDFPAQRRLDTSNLVVYQVWLNYYAQNPANGQMHASAFANAQAYLPDLADLGVTMVQLSPFHPFGVGTTIGSPYSVRDYMDVQPAYAGFIPPNLGTKEARIAALREYVAAAHQLGIQVIMDCVYHSTDPRNVLVTSNPEYYKHDAAGNFVKNRYGFYEFDFNSPGLRQYIVDMVKYWVQQVDIDGCRADVAVDVPLAGWAMLNNELKKVKPNWFMVAETSSQLAKYSGPYSGPGYAEGETYTNVYGFDAVYGVNYMLAERAILNKTQPASILKTVWQNPEAGRPAPAAGTILYRGVDNHDQRPRAAALASGNAGMLAAMAVNFTLDGIPFIFNGQELGDRAATSIANQTFLSWNAPTAPENRNKFKQLIQLRRSNPALNSGKTIWLSSDKPNQVVSFIRQSGSQKVLVVVNMTGSSQTLTVQGTKANPLGAKLTNLMAEQATRLKAANNRVKLSLGAFNYLILKMQ